MMKKTDFISLVQDEAFIQLVMEASNPNELLEDLVQKNPKESAIIRYAFEFIQLNLANKTKMNPEDYQEILIQIQEYSNLKTFRRFFYLSRILRIAASILFIIGIGSLVVYYQLSKDPLTHFAQSNTGLANQAIIRLSDGNEQPLQNNNSVIDYKASDGEVIVRNNDNEERIENKTYSSNAVLNQVVVPFGQRQKVLLSDGTLVQLNSGSTLTFPATFEGRTREVYLKGEGFFDVFKNTEVPFIVKTDMVEIKVLGTRFNVSAYEDEKVTSTVLVEGKVNVSEKNKMFSNKQYTLAPGQGCFYSFDEQNSVVKEVDINDYILWKDGLYNFKNLTLSEVVNRVHKYYNLSIEIQGDKLSKTLISGKLVLSNDINEVMQYLSKTMEARFTKSTDGTYIMMQ